MNKKYKVIAKEDLEVYYNHTWTKGVKYEVFERDNAFELTSNEGRQVVFTNEVKNKVLINFEIVS